MSSFADAQKTSKELTMQIDDANKKAAHAETEYRIEVEWRCALQHRESEYKDQIHRLQTNIAQLKGESEV